MFPPAGNDSMSESEEWGVGSGKNGEEDSWTQKHSKINNNTDTEFDDTDANEESMRRENEGDTNINNATDQLCKH